MSVIVAKRNLSSIQYIDTCRQIAVYTINRVAKMNIEPRKVFGDMLNKIILNVYHNLCLANATYVNDDTTYTIRKQYLENGKRELSSFIEMLSLCYEAFYKEFHSTNTIDFVSQMVDKEYNLIGGVLKADKERYYAKN